MKSNNRLILTTSPLSQPARKPRGTASLTRRQQPLYGRKRRYSTGKERDFETGLYYFGARYLDSKTGRWLSGDPAIGEYVPEAPVSDEARKRNGNLPGMGGVFNYVNLHVYHYAGNNPVKYIDPDGKWTFSLGVSGTATKGLGVQGSVGVAIGYSNGKGFSFGVYASGGTTIGIPSAGIGVTGSFSYKTESVSDLDGGSGSIGGGIGVGKGIGLDINTDDGSIDPASGISLTIGIKGSVIIGEGHVSTNETITASTSVPEIIHGMEKIDQSLKNFIIGKIMEQIPQ